MLDLIGSVLIAGFVILMGLRLNETISGSADASMAGLNVQQSMASIVQDLESDFRKIGYTGSRPETEHRARGHGPYQVLRRDLYRTGTIDSVEWFTVPFSRHSRIRTSGCSSGSSTATMRPGGAAGLGVTQFYLRYFTQRGTPWSIRSRLPLQPDLDNRDLIARGESV
jgi:hypothetical protein